MKNLIIFGAGAIALVAVPTFAQPGQSSQPGAGFTRAEVAARVRDAFARADADRDGAISRAEFFAPRAHADRAERRQDRAERRERRSETRGQRGMRFGGRAFERMDRDQDGRVSLAEATAARLQRFDRMDVNRDGQVTREERQSIREERRGDQG